MNGGNAKLQGIIFDLDGVITDTAEFHYLSWKRLAEEENIPFTRRDNDQLRGVPRQESLRRFLNGRVISGEMMQDWMDRKNRYYQAYLEELTPNDSLPGVRELISAAKDAGWKVGVGSASRNARLVLDKLNLTPLLDAIGDGNTVVNQKPASDIFMWVAGRMNLLPRQIVIFEDSEAGVTAGLNGGFWVVGVGNADVDHAQMRLSDLSNVSLSFLQEKLPQTHQG